MNYVHDAKKNFSRKGWWADWVWKKIRETKGAEVNLHDFFFYVIIYIGTDWMIVAMNDTGMFKLKDWNVKCVIRFKTELSISVN